MGLVDRGGGREAKGSSLRRSKKNPGAPSSRNQCQKKSYILPLTRSTPFPPPACTRIISNMIEYVRCKAVRNSSEAIPSSSIRALGGYEESGLMQPASTLSKASQLDNTNCKHSEFISASSLLKEDDVGVLISSIGLDYSFLPAQRHIDSSVAILSRRLEFDQVGLYRRAEEEGNLSAVLCWCAEQNRQTMLMETCKEHNKLLLSDIHKPRDSIDLGYKKRKKVCFAEGNRDAVQHIKEIGTSSDANSSQLHSPSEIPDGVVLYCLVGVHPNSIDSINLKLQEKWIEDIRGYAKNAEVLGILSGLDLSRGSDSHYAQEWMLRQSWCVAGELQLPLVLFLDSKTTEGITRTGQRVAVLLDELIQSSLPEPRAAVCVDTSDKGPLAEDSADAASHCKAPVAVVLHNGLKVLAYSEEMRKWVSSHKPAYLEAVVLRHTEQKDSLSYPPVVPAYVIATAEGLNIGSDEFDKMEKDTGSDCIDDWTKLLPQFCLTAGGTTFNCDGSTINKKSSCLSWTQILVGTASPWHTPQNLPDKGLAELPNEPGHYPYVVRTLYEAMQREYKKGMDNTLKQVERIPSPLVSPEALADLVLCNTLWVLFAEYIAEELIKDGYMNECSSSRNPICLNERHVDPSLTGEKMRPEGLFQGIKKIFVCTRCQNLLLDQFNYAIKLGSLDDSLQRENKIPQSPACVSVESNQVNYNVPLFLHDSTAMALDENGSYRFECFEFKALSVHGRLLYCPYCGAQVGSVNGGEKSHALSNGTIQALLTDVELVPYGYLYSRNLLTNSNENSSEKEERHVWSPSKAQCVMKKSEGEEKDTDSFEALLEQARRERDELERERTEAENHLFQDSNKAAKKRKDGKKNVKANNRSNFTHFRNKDFAPRSDRNKERERETDKITRDNRHHNVQNGFARDLVKHDLPVEVGTTMLFSATPSHNELVLEEKKLAMGKNYLIKEMCADSSSELSFTAPSRRQRKKNKKRQQHQIKIKEHHDDDLESDE